MNLYRVTVRHQDGTVSDRKTKAPSLRLALHVHGLDEHSEVVKVERINASNREVFGGLYNEEDRRSI
jgi:hypothetical protein